MTLKKIFLYSSIGFSLVGCEGMNMAGMVDAAGTFASAVTITDAEMQQMGVKTQQSLDAENSVASSSNKYTQRLNKITNSLTTYDGHSFNFKVYLTEDINAFAIPNGEVRVYSGLMDKMNDDELLFVIGHEIGHVVKGHSKAQLKAKLMTSATRQAIGSAGGIGALSSSQIGDLAETYLNAQYSQSQEYDADNFGLKVLTESGKSKESAISALKKLESLGGNSSIFSTHPAPGSRAKRIDQM